MLTHLGKCGWHLVAQSIPAFLHFGVPPSKILSKYNHILDALETITK